MYICRKMRLCNWLLAKGFHYLEECEDRINPRYRIWIFEDSVKLRREIEAYYHSDEFLNRN